MASPPDVNDIVKRAQTGDAEAFEALYRLYSTRVYSLCLLMTGNQAIAEELTQETFLLVYRRLNTFRGDSLLSTWLHRVAVNAVLMYFRKRDTPRNEVSLDEVEVVEESVKVFGADDPALAHLSDRLTLERCIGALPEGYQLMLLLHDVEGYEHSEIASLLSCSVGNTKSQLHKARKLVRQMLTGEVTQSAATARKRGRTANKTRVRAAASSG